MTEGPCVHELCMCMLRCIMHRFPRIASEASPAKLCLGKDMSWMPGLTSLHSNGPASSLPYLLDVTL